MNTNVLFFLELYLAQTKMLKIFSSINILSAKNRYYHGYTWLDMGTFALFLKICYELYVCLPGRCDAWHDETPLGFTFQMVSFKQLLSYSVSE